MNKDTLTLIIAFVSAGFAGYAWWANSRAADAAEDAAESARKSADEAKRAREDNVAARREALIRDIEKERRLREMAA